MLSLQKTIQPLKIIFFGAPYFSQEILKFLLKNNISIDLVITHPDQPVGRKKILTPTELKSFALENKLAIQEFTKLDKITEVFLKTQKPDLFIIAAYGTIIPQNILNIPKLGALNVHPSLLPKLRGASPIQTALQKGLRETGSTIMLMDTGMDTGDILQQKKLPIKSTEKYPELEEKLIDLSSVLLLNVIDHINKKRKLPSRQKQNDQESTYTKIIQKQDGLINWSNTSQTIYNQWRAFYSWPKIHTFYNNQKLILTEIELIKKSVTINNEKAIGEVFFSKLKNKNVLVQTGQGVIKINQLQLAGKKEMSIKNFINGQNNFIGSILK